MDSILLNCLGIYGGRLFDSAERVQKCDCLEFHDVLNMALKTHRVCVKVACLIREATC